MHRDMKPENILIHNNVHKISDYGLSVAVNDFMNEKLKEYVGTPLYSSP